MDTFIRKHSTVLLWVFGLLLLASQTVLLVYLLKIAPLSHLMAHQTTLSPNMFMKTLVQWGPQKVSAFLTHYYLDVIHPFLYAIFFSLWIGRLWKHSRLALWLSLFPILAGCCDLIENACQFLITIGKVPADSIWFYIGAISSRIKWVYLGITVIILAYGHFKNSPLPRWFKSLTEDPVE